MQQIVMALVPRCHDLRTLLVQIMMKHEASPRTMTVPDPCHGRATANEVKGWTWPCSIPVPEWSYYRMHIGGWKDGLAVMPPAHHQSLWLVSNDENI